MKTTKALKSWIANYTKPVTAKGSTLAMLERAERDGLVESRCEANGSVTWHLTDEGGDVWAKLNAAPTRAEMRAEAIKDYEADTGHAPSAAQIRSWERAGLV